jgi:hypothetical protein
MLHHGRGEIRSGEEGVPVTTGDMLLIRPRVAYRLRLPDGGDES